jgi:iron complex transport system substrate-binding protein
MNRFLAFTGLGMAIGVTTSPAFAGATQYPLTLDNCGAEVTFDKAPERAVGLGQASAEIMLLLGLEDRIVGTAFWPNQVLPQLAEANAKVKVLTTEFPTFESILAQDPDFVAAALPSLIGPSSRVA